MKKIHITNSAELDLSRQYTQSDTVTKLKRKPNGLWYSINNNWLHWVIYNMPDMYGKYSYALKFDETNFLKIDTKEKLKDFIEEFQVRVKPFYWINWQEVSQKYSAFEIVNYYKITKNFWDINNLWVLGLECDSGCVWDLNCVKRVKKTNTPKSLISSFHL